MNGHHRRQAQRGAALLLAMLILVLVSTMAANMVWQQWRAVQVEAAERARAQSVWILNGALDWSRLILREDDDTVDHLGEPWAVPLAEARLSTFLAVDRDNTADSGPEAFLSGSIVDAQSRYNLRNLINDGNIVPEELAILRLLCTAVGAPQGAADRMAESLKEVWPTANDQNSSPGRLPPQRLSDLSWGNIDPAVLERLKPFVTVLPSLTATAVNINTAPRELIAALIPGLDLGSAERIIQTRLRDPYKNQAFLTPLFDSLHLTQEEKGLAQRRIDVRSSWFIVKGKLRLEDRVLEETSLIERRGKDLVVRQRERVNTRLDAKP